jgi:hypothetical protein
MIFSRTREILGIATRQLSRQPLNTGLQSCPVGGWVVRIIGND